MYEPVQFKTIGEIMRKLDVIDGETVSISTPWDRIAAALGCPVDTLLDPAAQDPDPTVELLRLWALIEHEQDRRKVLGFLRGVTPKATA